MLNERGKLLNKLSNYLLLSSDEIKGSINWSSVFSFQILWLRFTAELFECELFT